jgi:hypothetical protein
MPAEVLVSFLHGFLLVLLLCCSHLVSSDVGIQSQEHAWMTHGYGKSCDSLKCHIEVGQQYEFQVNGTKNVFLSFNDTHTQVMFCDFGHSLKYYVCSLHIMPFLSPYFQAKAKMFKLASTFTVT